MLAATGAGQGVQLLTILQDLAQAQDRWGRERADTIVNNHRAKIIGAGVSDARTLEAVGRLLGDQQVPQESSTAGDGRASTTRSTSWRALAPPNVLRESEVGSAVLIYGTLPPARIRLRPWFAIRRLRSSRLPTEGSLVRRGEALLDHRAVRQLLLDEAELRERFVVRSDPRGGLAAHLLLEPARGTARVRELSVERRAPVASARELLDVLPATARLSPSPASV